MTFWCGEELGSHCSLVCLILTCSSHVMICVMLNVFWCHVMNSVNQVAWMFLCAWMPWESDFSITSAFKKFLVTDGLKMKRGGKLVPVRSGIPSFFPEICIFLSSTSGSCFKRPLWRRWCRRSWWWLWWWWFESLITLNFSVKIEFAKLIFSVATGV